MKDPMVQQMMQRIRVEEKPELEENQAEITVRLRDGRILEDRVEHPLGDPENPLSNEGLEEKARTLLSPLFTERRVDALLKKLWDFESVKKITTVTALLQRHPSSRPSPKRGQGRARPESRRRKRR
jgi:2-methylcitrate dehydratase